MTHTCHRLVLECSVNHIPSFHKRQINVYLLQRRHYREVFDIQDNHVSLTYLCENSAWDATEIV